MFKNPFSFNGLIKRTEFGVSAIIYLVVYLAILAIVQKGGGLVVLGIVYIPLVWFLWAQGAKRCHDLNKSGWWQIIPFYILWMLFQPSVDLYNQYGGESTVYGADDYEKPYGVDALGMNVENTPAKEENI